MLSGGFTQYIAQLRYPGLLTMRTFVILLVRSTVFKYVLSSTRSGAAEGAVEGCTIISTELVVDTAPQ